MVTAALFTIAKTLKPLKYLLMGDWIKKKNVAYTHTHTHTRTHTMAYYSALKKMKILPFLTTWMEREDIMLGEISQTEKDKYCMISLTYGILKKKWTHRYRE